ncbi:FMN-binding negative transcriptional regulator [Streptomyces sp. NBC_01142]|uniref:FMN-binding negative transcriptional regulator n=1 Tax=Streptomyces sp. NBC_01142 TaxID=2975865 RepID=UPI002258F874|nr:FMN-binding negative transcriptional regulator [Streptomyces sp. NBC_01142]MCX4823161.1 FMN-binding negative transcriptional regulator [Streptomyces sp. NBC_01142]
MLIHPWDAAFHDGEWRQWLSEGRDFGQLVVNNAPGEPPVVVPSHFLLEGDTVLLHFARANPVWKALEAAPTVLISVIDDYTYIPSGWRAKDGEPEQNGVPTAYYSAVHLVGDAEIVDDPAEKAELLTRQLAHHQPEGGHAQVAAGAPPYGRQLSVIRGIRVQLTSVAAKFKYDDHRPGEQRERIAHRLADRAGHNDANAAKQQLRRLRESIERDGGGPPAT